MREKRNVLFYILICCVSYTICNILLSILNMAFNGFMEVAPYYLNLQEFSVCFLIAVLMFFTDRLTKNCSSLLGIIVSIADVTVSVFGLGIFVFHWFSINPLSLIIAFGVLLAVYFGTFPIIYLVDKKWTSDLNKILDQRKKEKTNGKYH